MYLSTSVPTYIPTCKLPIYLYALPNCYIYNDIPGGRFVFTVTPGGFDFKDTPGGLEPSPSNRYLSVPFVGLLLNKTDGIPGGVEAGAFTFNFADDGGGGAVFCCVEFGLTTSAFVFGIAFLFFFVGVNLFGGGNFFRNIDVFLCDTKGLVLVLGGGPGGGGKDFTPLSIEKPGGRDGNVDFKC